jgi:hypothetical protein
VTSAVSGGGMTTVQGAVTGSPGTFTVELFANPPGSAAQGQQFLVAFAVTTDASGKATFSITLPTSLPAGDLVTTATDAGNDTSQFSQPVAVTG